MNRKRNQTFRPHVSLPVTICLALVSLIGARPAFAASNPSINVTLKPAAVAANNRVPYIEITVTLDGPAIPAGQPIVQMPLVTSNVETVAATLEDLSASDAAGPLTLAWADDPGAAASPANRVWHAARATSGSIVLHYRVPVSETLAPRGAAPPLELRSDTGAFSGQGQTFLLLPKAGLAWKPSITWDLTAMHPGAVGVSSFGLGNQTPAAAGIDDLGSSFFMAGDVHVYPQHPPATGFFGAWYGNPPFDLQALMASEQKLYTYYESFFHRPSTAPYGVFMRENLVNAGGGVSLGNTSFVTTFGPKTDLDQVKITLAHEMLHTFVGSLDGGEDAAWYAEGLAVYYARLFAMRAGQITPNQFLDDLNFTAARYYTDALIHTPNRDIAPNFWADTRIRVLPYDRGSMYFAVLDGNLRSATSGKQTLDTLLLEMLARRSHQPIDETSWREVLKAHLGDKGIAQFDAMLAGAVMLPEPQGFGPCFTRVTRPLRRYQLGFDPRVLVEHKRIVRGLIPDSAAAKAGVQDGDEITRPVPQDLLQGQQGGLLTLELLRNGKPLTVTYLPRAESVEAYQWVRIAAVPDSACIY
jgi:hypothetical protein